MLYLVLLTSFASAELVRVNAKGIDFDTQDGYIVVVKKDNKCYYPTKIDRELWEKSFVSIVRFTGKKKNYYVCETLLQR